jgi:hypothetical protein
LGIGNWAILDFGFWILDFGFWIEELISNLNLKSAILESQIGWASGIGN